MNVRVRSQFDSKLFASNVMVRIPCPRNTASAKLATTAGKAKYNSEKHCIEWVIKKFPGDQEFSITGDIECMAMTVETAWSRPPIEMDFSVPMFTASGLNVRFLKVMEHKHHYNTIKWVRYVTQVGSYQTRI